MDPTLHPVIEKDDPRWLGAWWLGWIIIGFGLIVLAGVLAMFPQNLRKLGSSTDHKAVKNSEVVLKINNDFYHKNLKN